MNKCVICGVTTEGLHLGKPNCNEEECLANQEEYGDYEERVVFEVRNDGRWGNPIAYFNGKKVVIGCNPDVMEEAEEWYAEQLFPGVEWHFRLDEYQQNTSMVPTLTTLREDYAEVMSAHDNQLLDGNFDGYDLDSRIHVQCETDSQVMLVFYEEVESDYWAEKGDE